MIDGLRRLQRLWRLRLQTAKDARLVASLPTCACAIDKLRVVTTPLLREVLTSKELDRDWVEIETTLEVACHIEDGKTGGINPGDRRAVYYLVRGLKPMSVLEIGTHVGASTVYLAAALRGVVPESRPPRPSLTTVDIQDVNDAVSAYWKTMGLSMSPKQMLSVIKCEEQVHFVQNSSLNFFKLCNDTFDFIFLDGDHSGSVVYQEIPEALRVLRKNGVILLHDYFPQNRPLWADGAVIPGPFIATERLRNEDAQIDVLPLGELPWKTKLNSRQTSLAILTRHRQGPAGVAEQ